MSKYHNAVIRSLYWNISNVILKKTYSTSYNLLLFPLVRDKLLGAPAFWAWVIEFTRFHAQLFDQSAFYMFQQIFKINDGAKNDLQ